VGRDDAAGKGLAIEQAWEGGAGAGGYGREYAACLTA